ncbi:NAD(P)-dependent oxidoreductase [Salipaludibacillus aurantiacus]|uniref:3-hydroxyisobutyrate dehydrogenase n=1 Tax=Salipaludibacillus aurantiacus TaxID=1601833 RepID=A0A1H9VBA7_9BACI|nr:NAD(P)-dependent oxidoreductase [Salipaludibacillus aurantiacus]SES18553.1 3-hydroxyisobutyrate dehydrogenase [Salipaludibacillus aurantiacus]
MAKKSIGFIGTGVMGTSMVRHLMKGGHHVAVYNRTKRKADDLIKEGAQWCASPAQLARESEVILTIVGYPHDVEELYFGKDGILANAGQGTYVVDMTTSKPALAQQLYNEAKKYGIYALDAPVSGGDTGAREAKLAIMAGGDEPVFKELLPVLELMGENIRLQGDAGAGQYTKMANQIAIASTMMGVSEALAYAKKAGLDQENVLQTIETGAAGSFSLSKLGPRMIAGDFAPGFYIKHFIKDMAIAIESADELGLKTPGLVVAKKLYQELAEKGEENSGTQALYKYYMENS